MSEIIKKLQSILADGAVLTGEDVSGRAARIWMQQGIEAKAIVRPSSTAELAAVMRLCYENDQRLVAQGGRTGLTDSHITSRSEIVLSLERMNKVEEIDPNGRTMTVQAGVPLQIVQQQAEKLGLQFPLDLGARGSCTIGGNAATNAGGNRVIRYGMARDNILGLEVVLADGTVLTSLNKMIKNNAGYDLKHLFIGTEGTLGVITRLVLRLREAAKSQDTALVAIDEFAKVIDFLKFIDSNLGGTLSAFEVMWQEFYQEVTSEPATNKAPLEQDSPYYVLVESLGADQSADSERFQNVLLQALQQNLLTDVVVAKSQAEINAIWAIRDSVGELHRHAPIFIFDVSLQIKYMSDYVQQVRHGLDKQWPGNRCFIFGHAGDGNLHYVIAVGDGSVQARRKVEACVYGPLEKINGSVSAEHGIGLEKKSYLSMCRSEAEIATMRLLKKALDPKGILNVGKIFD